MKIRIVTLAVLALAMVVGVGDSVAETKVFANGGDYNTDSKWTPVGVPGAQDTAVFTNNGAQGHTTITWSDDAINANALVTYTIGYETSFEIGDYTYRVTNAFSISPNAAGEDVDFRLKTGHLAVTNAGGTATLTVGGTGKADLRCLGGLLDVDRLVATNPGNAYVVFGAGTQTVWNGMLHAGNGSLTHYVGTCNIFGGSNSWAGGVQQSYGGTIVVGGSSTYLESGAAMFLGNGGGPTHFIVTNGGEFVIGSPVYVANNAASSGNHAITVTGSNSVMRWTANNFYLGRKGPSNTLTVADGGLLDMLSAGTDMRLIVGDDATSIDNRIHVTGDGSALKSYRFWLSDSGSGSALIEDGGLLQSGDIRTHASGLYSITNIGGIYQFGSWSPAIETNAPGDVYLRDGTISFYRCSSVEVRPADSTIQKITMVGTNTLRLAGATNDVPSPDDFVFETGLGADNYSRLELRDSAVFNGSLTIGGSDGELALAEGASSAANDLTLQSGATLEVELSGTTGYGSLNAQGAVTLGGATLDVVLTAEPTDGFQYKIIDKTGVDTIPDAFATSSVEASFDGTTYTFEIEINGGDGNDVVISYTIPKGTTITIQ